ncbi:unnamed protein product [Prunus armeniaca]|uniref:AP2/ERF domain-containing protein n=1 Tax=Prunus armeniaca TaxID=36596 RepID=A0A6J5WC19_PRUAR|nr:unnamed protein product [Prunus armeniaca]CAB4297923.1 unnamed protein product [Prunus armeniaca]
MSYSSEESSSSPGTGQRKFKGVRQRKWGKWVSEIRVPGTQDRLWLGSFSSPEAAAVARDVAYYCLRRPSTLEGLNFPLVLPSSVHADMSPRSIQKAASDAGMAVDAQLVANRSPQAGGWQSYNGSHGVESEVWEDMGESSRNNWGGHMGSGNGCEDLSISIEDYDL